MIFTMKKLNLKKVTLAEMPADAMMTINGGAFDQEAADKAKRAAEKAKAKPEVKKPCPGCTCSEAPYVRPDKPFSQFTAEEKRAYWREQNRKRRI